MRPKIIDLSMVRGDTARLYVTLTGTETAPEQIAFSVKWGFADALYVCHKTLDDGITLDGTEYTIEISPGDTAGIRAGRYVYDIELTINGDVITPVVGSIDILPDVTREVSA